MKQKTKNLLIRSFGLLSLVAVIIWYLFPVLMAKWLIYQDPGLAKYLHITPTYQDYLPPMLNDWDNIRIGDLSVKLPISKYKEIFGKEDHITFVSDQGSLVFLDLVPSAELLKVLKDRKLKYPYVSYEDRLAIVKSVPADISFFNSRGKNERSSANLILKAVGIPTGGLGEVRIVNNGMLKAICIISEKREKGFSVVADVYSMNESMTFTILLTHYKDKTSMNADLLNILEGIRLPNQPLDREIVKKDINAIVSKYKKPEQDAQPDSQ